MDKRIKSLAELGAGGHLMAAISGSGNSEYVIRWTEAVARRFGASWSAINVVSMNHLGETEAASRNLFLAEQAGAEIIKVSADDIAGTIVRNARIKKANVLVIGKAEAGGRSLREKPSLMDQILDRSGDLDVIVLQGQNPTGEKKRRSWQSRRAPSFRGVLYAAGLLASITLAGVLAQPALGYRAVSILYLLLIICLPFITSRFVVFTSAFASALLWNYLFIPPRLTFSIGSLEDILMFAAFFLAAFVGGFLTSRLKEKESALLSRERRMSLLYGFAREISQIRGLENLVQFCVSFLAEHLALDSSIWLDDKEGVCADVPHNDGFSPGQPVNDTVAMRCLSAGLTVTDEDSALYVPLTAAAAQLGVLYVKSQLKQGIHGETRELLATLAGNLALAIERELLTQENDRIKLAGESARLSKILLNHVSHELRTPLTTIKGATSGLLDGTAADDPELRSNLLTETLVAANKLNTIVEDLLAMSRLEAGRLVARKELVFIGELIGAAACVSERDFTADRLVLEDSARDFEVMADPALMVQVFNNLVRNFLEYTEGRALLRINAERHDGKVYIIFTDNGPGVSDAELINIFDTFFRGAAGQRRQGCGLGLSICRGIVEVHGGSVAAGHAEGGGLRITVQLPDKEKV
ncbi:MAG: DUF4118 domain-containing protein [Spirochaetes bacterium]|nr:DUF4118 domain-containing protein [Spirochaetota bacterium]MBU0955873.1 DUF4118 domain-containing protein [Spirochaetota bacterium]